MNTNGITFTAAKIPTSRIKVVGKVNTYVDEMLNQAARDINNVANLHNRDVFIAQRGDSLMVNSGAVTSMFNMNEMESGRDFVMNIINNIRANSDVNKNGIKKTLDKLV